MSEIRLLHIKKLAGQITVKTGLHIGAGRDVIEIGGMDNPIIVNPVTDEPYIPGSSLKGKMRSLSEVALGKVDSSGNTHQCKDAECPVCRIFGNTQDTDYGPTRLVVRDALLNRPKTRENLKQLVENFAPREIFEEKYENTIDRIKGTATNPRLIQRVVPGAVFDLEILYKVYDVDGDGGETDERLFANVKMALELIEHDYLGGSGSRGSGQVEIQLDEPQIVDPAKMIAGGE